MYLRSPPIISWPHRGGNALWHNPLKGFGTGLATIGVEQTVPDYIVRKACVISLGAPLSGVSQAWAFGAGIGRVTYTGGYVLPGTTAAAGQTPLPCDLESAAIEQVAVWFQNRDKLGLIRHWPSGGTYLVFTQAPLLAQVAVCLRQYRRWTI